MKSEEEGFKRLREPFPKEQIGTLPKAGIKLEYVGHGAVCSRLLEVDPHWTWEPVAFAPDGSPLIGRDNQGRPVEFWIKMTVLGVTRYGVGTIIPGAPEAPKQLISDAIRNAAMRFGVALDLWSKEELSESAQSPATQKVAKAGGAKGEAGPPRSASPSSDETGEAADDFDLIALRGWIDDLDDVEKKSLKKLWKIAALGSVGPKPTLLKSQVEAVTKLIRPLQDQVWLKRQKRANANMSEVGVKGDKARHELVEKATAGRTTSTSRLTRDQIEAVVAACEHLKQLDEAS